jgi:segregation and condensation protein B
MSLKAKVEAIIYATEEPVTLNELSSLLKDAVLADLHAQDQARLALNETISDGPRVETDEDEAFSIEEAAAEIADESSMMVLPEPAAPEPPAPAEDKQADEKEQLKAVKARLSSVIEELIADYASPDRGMEIRQIAGGYRMATKPEHHDVVVSFAKSLKPPVRLSLQALETLAVIAYKQPVTVPEISEIRGVDSAGVIATLLDRKLITTGGRKQVIGRPILYKTTKEFLMRFGLKDIGELPSMEEFEKLGDPQADLFNAGPQSTATDDSVTEAVPEQNGDAPLRGETDIPAEGVRESEAEGVMAGNPVSETSGERMPGDGDTSEPVTKAVPEVSDEHSLVGERAVAEDGTYATEAEPGSPSDKS